MAGSWVPLMFSLIYNKPLVVRCGYEMLRNMLRRERNKLFWAVKAFSGYISELMAYSLCDKIIISNMSDNKYIQKWFPVHHQKIRLIRNFINTDHFCGHNPVTIDNDKKSALYIGRIEERKNIENLIYASTAAKCPLYIVGKGINENHFIKIAKNQGGKVNFLGTINNRALPDIIRQHVLFILPSFYENNPKVLLEAMACSRVVLGTNVEGIRELIVDGESGFLCNPDALSIEKAIKSIFDMSYEKLNIIGKNARRFVVNECAIEKVYRQEMSLYNELLS